MHEGTTYAQVFPFRKYFHFEIFFFFFNLFLSFNMFLSKQTVRLECKQIPSNSIAHSFQFHKSKQLVVAKYKPLIPLLFFFFKFVFGF